MADIRFYASLDTTKLNAGVVKANTTISKFVYETEKRGKSLLGTFEKVGERLVAYGSIFGAIGLARQIMETTGQFQQLRIAFETMLDSKEKADKLMMQSITLAQKTPFTLMEVTTNAKQLMAMGVSFEKVMGTLKSLGDVAAGVSVPLSRLAINYGQVLTLGRLQQREIRDFAMAGVPLVSELAKNMGKTAEEVQNLVSQGKIGFAEVEKAFKTMSSEGGKFYNLMEKQNKSITGQLSNLTDKWQVMLNEIGSSQEGFIRDSISGTAYLIENYKEVGRIVLTLVGSIGVYKTSLMALNAIQRGSMANQFIQEANALKGLLTVNAQAALSDITLLRGKKAYAAMLENMTTQEYRNILAKKGVTKGTVEYAAAVKGLVIAQQRELDMSISSTTKQIQKNSLLLITKESQITATKALIATKQAELVSIEKLGNAKKTKIATNRVLIATKKLEKLETDKAVISKNIENLTLQKNTYQTELNTLQNGINNATKQKGTIITRAYTAATVALTRATAGLNAVWQANKSLVIIAALFTVGLAIYKLITAESALEKAQKKLDEAMKKSREEADNNVSEVERLLTAISDQTKGVYAQVTAYDELIKRFKFFEKFSRGDIEKMTEAQRASIVQEFTIGQDVEAAKKIVEDQKKIVEKSLTEISELENSKYVSKIVKDANVNRIKKRLEREEEVLKQSINNFNKIKSQVDEALVYSDETKLKLFIDTLEKDQKFFDNILLEYGSDTAIEGVLDIINKKLSTAKDALARFGKEQTTQNEAYWKKQLEDADLAFKALDISLKGTEEWNKKEQAVRDAQAKVNLYSLKETTKKESDTALKAKEDTLEKVAALDARYQADRVASLRIGYERQVKEIKAGEAEKLASLEKEYSDLRQKMRSGEISMVGGKAVGAGLTQEELDKITTAFDNYEQHRVNITKAADEEIRQLTFDRDNEIRDIMESQSAYYASQMDAQIADANRKYDNEKIKLIELGAAKEKLFKLELLHEEELKRIKSESAIRDIDFQEDIAIASIENSEKVYLFKVTKQRQILQEEIEAEQKRFDIYSSIATKESQEDAAKSAQALKAMRNQLAELNMGEVAEMGDAFEKIASSIQGIAPAMAQAIGSAGSLLTNVANLNKEIKSSNKSIISVATQGFGTFMGAVDAINGLAAKNEQKAEERRRRALERQLNYLNKINDAIDRGSQIDTWLVGKDRIDAYSNSIKNVVANINNLKNATLEAMNNILTEQAVNNIVFILSKFGGKYKDIIETVKNFESLRKSIKDLAYVDVNSGGGALKLLDSLANSLAKNKETVNELVDTINTLQTESQKQGWNFLKQDELDAAIQAADSLSAVGEKLYQLREQLMEEITGVSFSSAVDNMLAVFESGFDDLDGMSQRFTENFQELMRKALLQSFKVKMLEEPLRKWYETFASEVGDDNKLDTKEISKLRQQYEQIVEDGQKEWDNIMAIAGKSNLTGGGTSQTGLIGQIRAELTEATGTELAGIFRSTRDDGRKSLDTMRIGVSHLSKIEQNTADTVKRLDIAVAELRQINTNTKGVYTGVL